MLIAHEHRNAACVCTCYKQCAVCVVGAFFCRQYGGGVVGAPGAGDEGATLEEAIQGARWVLPLTRTTHTHRSTPYPQVQACNLEALARKLHYVQGASSWVRLERVGAGHCVNCSWQRVTVQHLLCACPWALWFQCRGDDCGARGGLSAGLAAVCAAECGGWRRVGVGAGAALTERAGPLPLPLLYPLPWVCKWVV